MTISEMKSDRSYKIDVDGNITEVTPQYQVESVFDLDQLYKEIGCDMIEIVSLRDGRIMIMDEEGKFKRGAKENKVATQLVRHLIQPSDFVVGNVIVCPTKMVE